MFTSSRSRPPRLRVSGSRRVRCCCAHIPPLQPRGNTAAIRCKKVAMFKPHYTIKADLIVDQTIEKVSFCAPDRNYDKAFSYICRDGTTRRWICHCFMALKDSGERLSHAVGCAFAACLERKQRREKECGVTASFDASRTSFVREGSFHMPCVVPALPPGTASPPEGTASPLEPGGPHAIPRRHAPIEQLVRQGSFRGFPALSGKNSPFKRQLSLRLNDLPSTLQRRTDFETKNPVLEMDMGLSDEPDCNINALCSQINTSFTKPPDEFFSHPPSSSNGLPACTAALPPPPAPVQATSSWVQADPPLHSPPAVSMAMQMHSGHRRTPSEAERWLEEVAKAVRAQQQTPPPSSMAPPPAPTIPTIPGPPTMSSQSITNQPSLPGPPGSLPSSMQPFPLVFDANPAPVGMFAGQPVQPAFVPMQTYMPGLASGMTYPNASGMTYPNASVPVVGITPSQMVANVFCTAATGSSGGAMGSIGGGPKVAALGAVGHRHPFAGAPGTVGHGAGGFSTASFPSGQPLPTMVNGLPVHGAVPTPAAALLNGNTNGGGNSRGSSVWPPEGSQLTAPASSVSQEADRFEAKWAALETKPAPVSKAPVASTANPFSNDLQKTFEIEL
ncbi:unnamed protein product [Merluccius merluccius]